jgi:single-strand DNA-binding protein
MRSVNEVTLIGNVGNDPEVSTLGSGTKRAKLSLATTRQWTSDKGKQEKTDWHRITAFGKTADIIEEFVRKGDRLYLRGQIEYSETEDDKGGKRYWTDILVRDVVMLGGRERERPPETTPRDPFADDESDGIPF